MLLWVYRFNFKYFYCCCLFLLCMGSISCNISFGGSFENTPEGNYNFFFYELSQTYAYKDRMFAEGLTLSEIQERERLGLDSSWPSLKNALERVIHYYIHDPHLYSVYSPVSSLELEYDEKLQEERKNAFDFYKPLFNNGKISWIEQSEFLHYGVLKSDPEIGYIYVQSLTAALGGSERLSSSLSFGKLIDSILTSFASRLVDKIIFDIRSNAGGAVHRCREIAARFVSSERTFMISEYLNSASSYTVREEKISPAGLSHYRNKPLVVLVNTNTCSGGEMLLLMLQQSDGYLSTIGTPTRGCAGTIIDRELPNGWIFTITSSRTFAADRTDYFKVGIQPDKTVIAGSNDAVLSEAILILQR